MVHSELQKEALGKDQARIDAMRARNEARRERFLNARQRSIGVDVRALDEQVAENASRKAEVSADDREYHERMTFIAQLVEQREAQDSSLKKAEMQQLRGVWDAQRTQPKNEMGKMSAPVIADQCGLASVQKFDGEDRSRAARTALQKAQMRSWTMQQVAEKGAREAEAVTEDLRYAEYLKTVQEARDTLEGEEADERRRQTTLMKDDNKALAAERAAKLSDERVFRALADAQELAHMDADPMLSENTAMMTSALGAGRIRGDHFKGFSKAQVQQIYLDNEAVLAEKAVREAARTSDDAVFVAQHDELRKLVEESEYQQKQFQRSLMAEHGAILEQQKLEQRELRARESAEARGHIGPGLMDGFGCSWR